MSTSRRSPLAGSALLAVAVSWTLPVQAQPVDDASRSAARQVGEEGLAAYDQGQYVEALAKLGQAYAVVKAPALGLWTARTMVKLGRLVEASERYLEVTRLPTQGGDAEVQDKAKQEAERERGELLPRIPKLRLRIQGTRGEPVEVQVDGLPVPAALLGAERPVNPGKHRVTGKMGSREVSQEVTVAERESKEVEIRFDAASAAPVTAGSTPVAAPPSAPMAAQPSAPRASPRADQGAEGGSLQRTAGWISLGVGGAGLVVGSITGVLLLSKKSSLLDGDCVDTACGPTERDRVDSYNSLRPVSTVSFVVGFLGAGVGAALLLTAPKPEQTAKPRVTPWVGLGSAGLAGRF
jgi:hypothetical protein